MNPIEPEPIESKKEIRPEAANDNVIELTDVIEEARVAKFKPAEKKFDMVAIKEKARVRKMEREARLLEATNDIEMKESMAESFAAVRDSMKRQKLSREADALDIPIDVVRPEPPKPTAEEEP